MARAQVCILLVYYFFQTPRQKNCFRKLQSLRLHKTHSIMSLRSLMTILLLTIIIFFRKLSLIRTNYMSLHINYCTYIHTNILLRSLFFCFFYLLSFYAFFLILCHSFLIFVLLYIFLISFYSILSFNADGLVFLLFNYLFYLKITPFLSYITF